MNNAAVQQQVMRFAPQHYERPSSPAAYCLSRPQERQFNELQARQQQAAPFYNEPCGPTSYYGRPVMNSTLASTWSDATYNALDRADGRLGPYYDESRNAALLAPVFDYVHSAPTGHNPLDDPSLLDSATINPKHLTLPTNDMREAQQSSESEECPECQKSFCGPNAVKNVK